MAVALSEFHTQNVLSSMLPGGQPGAAPLIDFGQQSGTQLTWIANFTAGNMMQKFPMDYSDSSVSQARALALT